MNVNSISRAGKLGLASTAALTVGLITAAAPAPVTVDLGSGQR